MTNPAHKRLGGLFRRRLPLGLQADLLGRLAITLRAGIDLRKAWASEVQRLPNRWRPRLNQATLALNGGEMLAEALMRTDLFEPIVMSMVAVGDQTGRDVDTLREISRMLNHTVQTSRQLRASLVWPGFQLVLALGVVGLLIFLGGMIEIEQGKPLDFIGLGLLGMSGLIRFGLILIAVVVVAAISSKFVLANWRNHGLTRQLLNWVPLIGPAARASEAASWSRAASLAAGAGLDAGRLVEMAGTVAPGLAVDARWIEDRLLVGDTLSEALAASQRFPAVLIEGIAVGESSGMVSEVLGRLSEQFADEARRGFEASAKAAGGGIWMAVAGLIILVIFRVFSVYVGILQDAVGGI